MRTAGVALLLLAAGCAPAARGGGAGPAAPTAAIDDIAANIVAAMPDDGLDWTNFAADRVFSPASPAARLARPPALADAELGYFDDPAIRRQYGSARLAAMRRNDAGFTATLDRDGDGRPETYRTGYWRRRLPGGETREGTFLVVFADGRQRDLVNTTAEDGEGVFLSWRHGRLDIADCNCPHSQQVVYAGGKLRVTPYSD